MSTVSSAHMPRSAAVSIIDTPNGPGKAFGNSVRTEAVHGRMFVSSVIAAGCSRQSREWGVAIGG
jgi:hypothetical protein